MKKKILICLLVCVGLFVGLTCFAADEELTPGAQNENYTAYEGFDIVSIFDFIDGNVITIPANTVWLLDYHLNVLIAELDYTPIIRYNTSNLEIYTSTGNYTQINSISNDVNFELNGDYLQITFNEPIIITISNDYISNYSIDNAYWLYSSVNNSNIGIEIIEGTTVLFSSVGLMFANIFTAAAGIVYNSNDGITTVGWLMLIGLGIALFMFGLRFIRGLINKVRSR